MTYEIFASQIQKIFEICKWMQMGPIKAVLTKRHIFQMRIVKSLWL